MASKSGSKGSGSTGNGQSAVVPTIIIDRPALAAPDTSTKTDSGNGAAVPSGSPAVVTDLGDGATKTTIVETSTGQTKTDTSTAAKVKDADGFAALLAILSPDQLALFAKSNPAVAEFVKAKAAAASPKIAGELATDKIAAYLVGHPDVVAGLKAAAAVLGNKLDLIASNDTAADTCRAHIAALEKANEDIRKSEEFAAYSRKTSDTAAAALGTDADKYRVLFRILPEVAPDNGHDWTISATKTDSGRKTGSGKGSGQDGKPKAKVTVKVSGADGTQFIGTRKEFYAIVDGNKELRTALPDGARKIANFTQLVRLINSAQKDGGKYTVAGYTITYTKTYPAAAADTSTKTDTAAPSGK